MLTVRWSERAIERLDAILAYVAEHNPSAALDLQSRIERATARLPANPYLYRRGRVAGTREIVVLKNYIVTVSHARQRFRYKV